MGWDVRIASVSRKLTSGIFVLRSLANNTTTHSVTDDGVFWANLPAFFLRRGVLECLRNSRFLSPFGLRIIAIFNFREICRLEFNKSQLLTLPSL